jgi:hypothetical protein
MLPEESEYRVIHRGANGDIPRGEWNVTHFVPLGRYGSESVVSFKHYRDFTTTSTISPQS